MDASYPGPRAQDGGRLVTWPATLPSRRIRVEHGITLVKNAIALARSLGHREHASAAVQAAARLPYELIACRARAPRSGPQSQAGRAAFEMG
ncbi:hypothetical protein [Streptomyces sp. NBC_01601]|uniref:hypothetical protein n=1 Tax=Streptomyces sp. NBC_01601 TaxID=2975892 RepID=UPI002E2B41C7|nr:hypothetical protein [Streptomyces sp. NBC_01601]